MTVFIVIATSPPDDEEISCKYIMQEKNAIRLIFFLSGATRKHLQKELHTRVLPGGNVRMGFGF